MYKEIYHKQIHNYANLNEYFKIISKLQETINWIDGLLLHIY